MSRTQIQAWIWEAGVHFGFEDVCSRIEELIGDPGILEVLNDLQYTRLLFASRKLQKLTRNINATRDYRKPIEDLLAVVINLLRNKIVYDYKTLIEQLFTLYQNTILFEHTLVNYYEDTEKDREDSLSLSLPFNEEKWERVKKILGFMNDLYKDMASKIANFELDYKGLVKQNSVQNYDLLCSSLRSKIRKLFHDLVALVKKLRQPYIVNVCRSPKELKRLNFSYHRIILDNIQSNVISADALHRIIDQLNSNLPRLSSTSSVDSIHSDGSIMEITLPTIERTDEKILHGFTSEENIHQRNDNDNGESTSQAVLKSSARDFNIAINGVHQERASKALHCKHMKKKTYDIVILKGKQYIIQNHDVDDDDTTDDALKLKDDKINSNSESSINIVKATTQTDVPKGLDKVNTPQTDATRVANKATTFHSVFKELNNDSFDLLCSDVSKLDKLTNSVKDLVKELDKKCELLKVRRDAVLRCRNSYITNNNQTCSENSDENMVQLPNLNDCIESHLNENISDKQINEETKSSKNDTSEISLYNKAFITNVEDCNQIKYQDTNKLNINFSTKILHNSVDKIDSLSKAQNSNITDISMDAGTSKFGDDIDDTDNSYKNSKDHTHSSSSGKSISMPNLSLQKDIIGLDISSINNIRPIDSADIKTSTPNGDEKHTDEDSHHEKSMPDLTNYEDNDHYNDRNVNKLNNASIITFHPLEKKQTSEDDGLHDGNCNDTTSMPNLTKYEDNASLSSRRILEPSDSLKIKELTRDDSISINEDSEYDKSIPDLTRYENNDYPNSRNVLENPSSATCSLKTELPSPFIRLNCLSSNILKRIKSHSFVLVSEKYPCANSVKRSVQENLLPLSKINVRVTHQHDISDSPAIILETNIVKDSSDTRKESLQDSPKSIKRKLELEDCMEEKSLKKSKSTAVQDSHISESRKTITGKQSLLSQKPPESFELFLKILNEGSEVTEDFSPEFPSIMSPEISQIVAFSSERVDNSDENILKSAGKISPQPLKPKSPTIELSATFQTEVSASTKGQQEKGRELTENEASLENSLKDFSSQKLMKKSRIKLYNVSSSSDDDENSNDSPQKCSREVIKSYRQIKKKKDSVNSVSQCSTETTVEQEEKRIKKKKKNEAVKNNGNSEDEGKGNVENTSNINTNLRPKHSPSERETLSLSTSSSFLGLHKRQPLVILADVLADRLPISEVSPPNSSSTEYYTPDSTKELVNVDDDEDVTVVFDSSPIHNTRNRSKIR